jgi:phosphate transport system ATP-binding protein
MPNKSTPLKQQNILQLNNVSVSYSGNKAVDKVSFGVKTNHITAMIGPSGCGKSTLLRCLNRMNDFIDDVTIDGEIMYKSKNLYADTIDPVDIRREIGMVFQKPNPFPKSIYKNITWGPQINQSIINKYAGGADELVETALKRAALWNEVKDRLHDSALALSGGQQQRLCIARALAMEPEILLMDEPCSALDPRSTASIEDLLFELKKSFSIVIVTHNMQQAARVSDFTAFLENGRLIEFGVTNKLFTKPKSKRTEDYVTGRFG